jgi:hypothetical protein
VKRSRLQHFDRPGRILHHLEPALRRPGCDRERPPGIGQGDAPAGPLEQAEAERPFEVVDLLGDRALCQMERRRGARDLLMLCDREERAELLDREGRLGDPLILALLMSLITSYQSTKG